MYCSTRCAQSTQNICGFFFSFQRHRGKHKLSVCSKICFAIGGAPYQITGCALGFFLQMYLLDVVQVNGALAGYGVYTQNLINYPTIESTFT